LHPTNKLLKPTALPLRLNITRWKHLSDRYFYIELQLFLKYASTEYIEQATALPSAPAILYEARISE
jgi:hypothetical protein